MSRIVSNNLFAWLLVLTGMIARAQGGDNPPPQNVKEEMIPGGDTLSDSLQQMQRVWQEYHIESASPDQKLNVIRATRQLHTKAAANVRLSTEQFVRTCYMCASRIASEDFGTARSELPQRILIGCLPYLEAVPTKLAVNVNCAMSSYYDSNGKPFTEKTVSAYRNMYVRYHLRAWERVESDIDPTWRVDDPANRITHVSPPGYPPGTRPEEIKEPELRAEYEAIAKKSERNSQQWLARRLKEFYLRRLKKRVAEIYRKEPVAAEDLDLLKACLRIHVSDEKLRNELFEIAQSAAKGKVGAQTKPPGGEKR